MSGRMCAKYIICCLVSLMVLGGMMAASGASGFPDGPGRSSFILRSFIIN